MRPSPWWNGDVIPAAGVGPWREGSAKSGEAVSQTKKPGSAMKALPGFLEDSVCVNGASGRNRTGTPRSGRF